MSHLMTAMNPPTEQTSSPPAVLSSATTEGQTADPLTDANKAGGKWPNVNDPEATAEEEKKTMDENRPGNAQHEASAQGDAETNQSSDGNDNVPFADSDDDQDFVSTDGDEIEEEVLEEEYYEEEYDEEEIIEEISVDDIGQESATRSSEVVGAGESTTGESAHLSSAGGSGQEAGQSFDPFSNSTDASPASGEDFIAESGAQLDPDGSRDFAFFPPMDGDETADQPTDYAQFGSTMASTQDGETADVPSAATFPTNDAFLDEENQQNVPFTPAPSYQDPASNRGIEGEKDGAKVSPIWYWLIFFLICILLGGGAFGGWYLVTESREDSPDLGEDDSLTNAPTSAPTVGFTTPFNPIQGDCDFKDIKSPNVIDQCLCVGEIQLIANDVRARYESHLTNFIPFLYEDYDDVISSCSPRNQALVWISSANDFEFSYEERVERFSLATVYAGLGGTKWVTSTNWLSEDSVCSWTGVTCDPDSMVQNLDLSDNRLEGMMPPEVALLSNMLQLFAARNEINGPIPEGLFFIEPLQLVDMSFNSLTGPIPPALGNAKMLQEINLENNFLGGRLSQQLGGAESLEILNLGTNQLVGELPVQIFDLTSLKRLDLRRNLLGGTIPSEIANLKNLTSLTLGPNAFQGDVPSGIGELTKLEFLTLRDSPLLRGRLPASYGRNLKALIELTISGTNIDGNIETEFGDLPKLVKMDLSRNQLRSSIPMELGNLKNLTVLDLADNFLDGAIPVTLGSLANLTELSLNNNLLGQGVPNQFASLQKLQILRLEDTLLTGRVTQEVCDLRNTGMLAQFVVDCPFTDSNGVQTGVICDIPACCTGCRNNFSA